MSQSNGERNNKAAVDSRLTIIALDLMERMLVFDPKKRVSASEALGHSYFFPYRDQLQEPVEEKPFCWPFESDGLSLEEWKEMM